MRNASLPIELEWEVYHRYVNNPSQKNLKRKMFIYKTGMLFEDYMAIAMNII